LLEGDTSSTKPQVAPKSVLVTFTSSAVTGTAFKTETESAVANYDALT